MRVSELRYLIGTGYAFSLLDKTKIKKREKVYALQVNSNNQIVNFRTDVGDITRLRVYTIELLTEDFFRLYQVGSYEDPVSILYTGYPITKYLTENYKNWNSYRLFNVHPGENHELVPKS